MRDRETVAHLLASSFVDVRWNEASLIERATHVAGKPLRWIDPFVGRLVARFPGPRRPRCRDVTTFLLEDESYKLFCRRKLDFSSRPTPEMQPAWPEAANAPSLCDVRQLADWLGIGIAELDWFADLRCFAGNNTPDKLRHYRYRVLAKRFGAARLIELPKPRLKELQRHILRELLDVIAPHDAAHGFRKGRSIATFVAPHLGRAVVARMDLCDFFPSITRARVAALYRTIGYPEQVAEVLAGLCTCITPSAVWDKNDPPLFAQQINGPRSLYGGAHLPQGAPTSPAIANLCAFRLDCRLLGLARSAGANYTRYADDLAFSGNRDFARGAKRFLVHAAATAAEEGFRVHHRKTRLMREGVRQHLAGVVVNRRLNIRRADFDRLKAILVNCCRYGPADQNRQSHPDFRAHLRGRIAFVEQLHPARGKRLLKLFEEISW
jgi:RNA-directed DNA polymerase